MCAAHVCASTLSSQSTPRTCQSADSRVKTTVKASRKKTKNKTHKQDLPSWPSTRPSASMCSARPRSSRRRAACLQVSHAHVAGRREGGGRQGERRRVHPDAHFTRTKSREEKNQEGKLHARSHTHTKREFRFVFCHAPSRCSSQRGQRGKSSFQWRCFLLPALPKSVCMRAHVWLHLSGKLSFQRAPLYCTCRGSLITV